MADFRHGTSSAYNYHKCKCDVCRAWKSEQSRIYYLANQEKIKAQSAARYVATPRVLLTEDEKKARNRAAVQRWKDANRDRVNAVAKTRYERIMATNPEHIRKLRRDYAKTSYGRALYRQAQELRRRGVPYTQESLDWIASINWSTELCTYCEDAPATEIDHILPITKDGSGERDNLTPVCRTCNARKGNRYLADFLGFVEPERMLSYA